MFVRNLLILTICLTIPSSIFSQDGASLMDPSFIKKYLPAEYHDMALGQIGTLQNALGQGSTSTSTTTSTITPPVPTLPSGSLPISHNQVPHNHQHVAPAFPTAPVAQVAPVAPTFNPYMPSAAPSQANMHTHYAAPAPQAAPVAAPVANVPVANTGGPVNPFLSGGVVDTFTNQNELYLEADLNATPVFHPPSENVVPQYPPIEGQHWYQYRISGQP